MYKKRDQLLQQYQQTNKDLQTLKAKTVKTNDDIENIENLEFQNNINLNDLEQTKNGLNKVEITYEVIQNEKIEKDKYRTALLNVIKGDRVNSTQYQVDKNIVSQKYIFTLIKTITKLDGTKQEITINSPSQIDKIVREYYS